MYLFQERYKIFLVKLLNISNKIELKIIDALWKGNLKEVNSLLKENDLRAEFYILIKKIKYKLFKNKEGE